MTEPPTVRVKRRVIELARRGELWDTLRAAAIEVLKPVLRKAVLLAAKYAVTRGPDLVTGWVARGRRLALVRGRRLALARGRRLPVQEHVDVGVDLETAYDQFTQVEDRPRFMHRAERIERRDDKKLLWRGNGGTQTTGVVTFHRLSDTLTRIAVTMDVQPKGLFEKVASGMRVSRRALKSDLMRFKACVELSPAIRRAARRPSAGPSRAR